MFKNTTERILGKKNFAFFLYAIFFSLWGCSQITPIDENALKYSALVKGNNQVDGETVKIVVYGDTRVDTLFSPKKAQDTERLIRRKLVEQIALQQPHYVIHTGDMTFIGSDATQWNHFSQDTFCTKTPCGELERRKLLDKQTFYPVLGNHEYKNYFWLFPGEPGNYFNMFDKSLTKSTGNGISAQHVKIYSFPIKNHSYLIVLDTNMEKEGQYPVSINPDNGRNKKKTEDISPYERWFDEQLEKASGRRTLLIALHHPLFACQNAPHDVRKNEEFLLKKIKEHSSRYINQHIIVFSGHNHFFEHYSYHNEEKQNIDFIVTGGGGAPLEKCCNKVENKKDCEQSPFNEFYKPDKKVEECKLYSQVNAFSKYHYILMTLDNSGKSTIKTCCLPAIDDKKQPIKPDTQEWDNWKATEEECK
jgi:hypothetical protein